MTFRISDLLRPRNGLCRVRWILPPVIAMDTTMTMLGQPESYWAHPATGDEYNQFFAWFLAQGAGFFLWTSLLYILGAVLVASVLPRRLALVALLAYVMGHYEGACSWIINVFGFGMWAVVLYGLLIACGLVLLGVDVRQPATRGSEGA